MKILTATSLLIASIAASAASAAEYYVKSNGSDYNTGTTTNSPWMHCPGMAGWNGNASLKAGDIVYFKSDDTWNISSGSQALSVVGGVTYDGRTWGDGTRAKFNIQAKLGSKIIAFNDDDNTYETAVVGFEIDGNENEVLGVTFGWPSGMTLIGATKRVEDCLIHHCGNANESGYNYGVYAGSLGGHTLRNIQIINCVIHDIGRSGLCNYSSWDNANNKTENVLFRGNEVYNAGLNTSGSAGIGILLKDHSVGTVVEFNYVHDCVIGISLEAQSPHIYGPQDAIVRHNIIAGNDGGPGVYIQAAGSKSFDMYGNIIYGNGKQGLLLESNNKGDVAAKIYNNIFYDNCLSSGIAEVYLNNVSGAIDFDIRNNIINPENGVRGIVDLNGSYITTHNNNLLYRADGGTLVTRGGSNYSSSNISSWESSAVVADPGFFNEGNLPEGFSGTYGVNLQPASPGLMPTQNVKGQGQTLVTEFAGAINLSGTSSHELRSSAWDIGAYALSDAAYEPDTDAPTPPAGLEAAAISTTQINLTWQASLDDTGVSEYRVYRDGMFVTTTTATSFSDTGLAESASYTYTVLARDTSGNESDQSLSVSATTLTPDPAAMSSSSEWQSRSFEPQSGRFVVEYDAVALGDNIDGVTGLSQGNADDYYDLAVTSRFYSSGVIDVKNRLAYEADVAFTYKAGVRYHHRIVVDVPNHLYSVYVTEIDGAEILLAQDYSFRVEQETVESLDTWSVIAQTGGHQILNFSVTPEGAVVLTPPARLTATATSSTQINLAWDASSGAVEYLVYRGETFVGNTTATSYLDTALIADTLYSYTVKASDAAGNDSDFSMSAFSTTLLSDSPTPPSNSTAITSTAQWQNRSFEPQSGRFVIEYDAVASGASIDGVTGLSLGDAFDYADLAVTPRFNLSGKLDARDGSVYTSDFPLSYTSGTIYHVRMVVDVPSHKYSIYVQENGGSESLLAADYLFRTGTETVGSLDTLAVVASSGSHVISNLTVIPVAIPAAPSGLHVN